MRYLIQISVMLGDLMLIGACSIGLYFYWKIFPLNLIIIFLIVKNFKAWSQQGGFMAWNPKVIRSFLKNAKEIGL